VADFVAQRLQRVFDESVVVESDETHGLAG
jgi:hypothetical protein